MKFGAVEDVHRSPQRVVAEPPDPAHVGRPAAGREARPLDEVAAGTQRVDEALDLARVHAAVGVDHHDVLTTRRGESGAQRGALAGLLLEDDADVGPHGARDLHGPVGRPAVDEDDLIGDLRQALEHPRHVAFLVERRDHHAHAGADHRVRLRRCERVGRGVENGVFPQHPACLLCVGGAPREGSGGALGTATLVYAPVRRKLDNGRHVVDRCQLLGSSCVYPAREFTRRSQETADDADGRAVRGQHAARGIDVKPCPPGSPADERGDPGPPARRTPRRPSSGCPGSTAR